PPPTVRVEIADGRFPELPDALRAAVPDAGIEDTVVAEPREVAAAVAVSSRARDVGELGGPHRVPARAVIAHVQPGELGAAEGIARLARPTEERPCPARVSGDAELALVEEARARAARHIAGLAAPDAVALVVGPAPRRRRARTSGLRRSGVRGQRERAEGMRDTRMKLGE